MHTTCIDMSSAFDTIIGKGLIKILEKILPEDEVRMAYLLHISTSLDMNIQGVETQSSKEMKDHL